MAASRVNPQMGKIVEPQVAALALCWSIPLPTGNTTQMDTAQRTPWFVGLERSTCIGRVTLGISQDKALDCQQEYQHAATCPCSPHRPPGEFVENHSGSTSRGHH